MRLGAYPGPLQIETPFAIPDTTQASFRDDMVQHYAPRSIGRAKGLIARAQIRRRQPASLVAFDIEAYSLPLARRADA